MNGESVMPVIVVLTSLLTGLAIFPLSDDRVRIRNILNMTGAITKLVVVGVILAGSMAGVSYETRIPFLPDHDLVLRVESISLLFASLSALLWFFTTIYGIGYLEDTKRQSRFFGFFGLCVAATMGITLAGNLVTLVLFYEVLTITTYPLVAHRGTPEALRAGSIYLAYTLTGGVVVILGTIMFHHVAGPVEFVRGGALDGLVAEHRGFLLATFAFLVGGFGVKAAIVPLHGWLPAAMVAPTPVSALLHAVAVVKAGVFGITRVLFDVFGPEASAALGASSALLIVAAFTILYASFRALFQTELKRLLAYSTISQLSYIVLGVSLFGALGATGGLAHLVHQGLMKVTLFFAAGCLSSTLGVHKIAHLDGVGRRMPITMASFTVAAFGMIGLPPMAGFVSKWYLSLGGLEQGSTWVVWIMAASALLNAAYFLPVVYRAWFRQPDRTHEPAPGRFETRATLWVPTLSTAILSLLAGVFASTDLSPLTLAGEIAATLYP